MSNILVFLQQHDGALAKASLSALTCAHELKSAWSKDKVFGICLGAGADQAAEAALQYGFEKVLYSTDGEYEKYRAIPYATAMKAAFEATGSDTFVTAATSSGKDFAPRLSAMLDAAQASDVVGVLPSGHLKRPMYAGNVFAEVELASGVRVVTVRATAFQPHMTQGKSGVTEQFSCALDCSKAGEVIGIEGAKSERPELGDAAIVVSGGRALQSAENFEKVIFPLADTLGAAVGASRAAVDSGYAPNDWQVGQTGKVVAPNLYIAVGISGAIQHLAGMKDSKVIVAINKDPDAPIFEIADYGLVADLYQAVPELTSELKKLKGA